MMPPVAVPPGMCPAPVSGKPEGRRVRDSAVVIRVGVDDAWAAAIAVVSAMRVWVAASGVDVAVPTGDGVCVGLAVDTAVGVPELDVADGIGVPDGGVCVPVTAVCVAAMCVAVAVTT